MRLAKAARIRRRREFVAVQERGRRLYARELVILSVPGSAGHARLGITVSSRVGNAVVRNQIKRWVREAFRAVAEQLPQVDLVVIARQGASELGMSGTRAALEVARQKLEEGRP